MERLGWGPTTILCAVLVPSLAGTSPDNSLDEPVPTTFPDEARVPSILGAFLTTAVT